jgi:hypothetical protein
VLDLFTRTYFLARLFPHFRVLTYMYRSLLPSVPAVAAVFAIRFLESGPRTLEMVLLELFVYLAVTAAATFKFERALLVEIVAYLKGGGRVREAT